MKKTIHPKYEKTKVECSCGYNFETRSTAYPHIKISICSQCHPFFTGKQKLVDIAGRVDKFKAKIKAAEEAKQNTKDKTQKTKKSKESIKEIKEELKENTVDIKKVPKQAQDKKEK